MSRTSPSPSSSAPGPDEPHHPHAFTIVSYNLWHNKGASELGHLVETQDADILCLQEATTAALPETLHGLHRVVATGANRLGLAIYSRDERFAVVDTRTIALGKSMHDRVMSPTAERLVAARLLDRSTSREFVVASFHAAPLSARNSVRRAQIRAAHDHLADLGEGLPHIMIGDYNYPWFAGGLAKMLVGTGHTLTRPSSGTYRNYGVVRGKFDVVTSIGATLGELRALPKGASDHFPIVVRAAV
ncbi:endonuclease/exonuclease/phosphatase family protein [Frondihabitans australicus]|uniref:Endonuclease/exonuclease/phosphatase (EEP) superfamily protein YafD n=1 Tax=Frondihabitans australicus TaxID=386892 RepID=A0A495IJF1_9MICO|nr:endonuclease/exonuclease/phosphatase family protein [Frondihabitans australicus]RKR76152.1 endonuclease/exonuclease/phosphatase (EEP) superfamily protein YafD [Frondihabitans australicus]